MLISTAYILQILILKKDFSKFFINTAPTPGKDGSSTDFMRLTMIDPATSWFKIVELVTLPIKTIGKEATIKNTKEADMIFDTSSAKISNLV